MKTDREIFIERTVRGAVIALCMVFAVVVFVWLSVYKEPKYSEPPPPPPKAEPTKPALPRNIQDVLEQAIFLKEKRTGTCFILVAGGLPWQMLAQISCIGIPENELNEF